MNKKNKRIIERILIYIILIIGAIGAMFPFYWMVSSSLKPSNEILQYPPELIPSTITLEHFIYVFNTMDVPRSFMNSVIVSGSIVILNAILSGMVAYALAKLKFPGKKALFALVLAFMMLPFQLLIVPLYSLIVKYGLIGTYAGMILPSVVTSFSIYLLRQGMITLPNDYIEAVRIDGSGHFRIFAQIITPMMKPVFATVILTNFFWSWNNFLWPMMVAVQHDEIATLQVAINRYRGVQSNNWGAIMASCTLTAIPIVIVYMVLQRQFIESVATSGVKG